MNTLEKQSLWKEFYPVRFYEVGPDRLLTLGSLCNFLQNSSANHIDHLGVGLSDLGKKNHTWILSRMLISIKAMPSWKDILQLKTWQVKKHKLFAIRDYTVDNQEGETIVQASGSWMVIDTEKRRPVPCGDYVEQMNPLGDERALDRMADRVNPLPYVDMESLVEPSSRDMDINGHVNNVKYIEWFYDNMMKRDIPQNSPMEIEVNYLGESFAGDRLAVQSFSCEEHRNWIHSLVNRDTGQELCRARIHFL